MKDCRRLTYKEGLRALQVLSLKNGVTDACVRSADPADVVVPHMAVSGNPLQASFPTAGFAPNNRHQQQGSVHSVLKMGPNQCVTKEG